MLRCNISKIKWYDWQTERGKVKDKWKYSDGHWGTVCDDQWDINNFFISDVICKMPNYSPPQSSPRPPDTQSSRKCWLVLLFFQISSWETSGGSFYGGNNFKAMFKTKQLLNKVKFWCKWGIRLVWWLATCTNRSHNQWSFKQWVGILLMTKIDRVCKNYLTPKIWEESHLRETFYGTLIFQQSSMICICRHVGGHTLALQHGGQNYFLLVCC